MLKDEKAAMKILAVSVVLIAAVSACRREPAAGSGGLIRTTFTIRAVAAERSGDHLHLTVTVRAKNAGSIPLALAPPAAQLWIGSDKPAAPFIAPGLEPALVAPGGEAEGATHWWLAASDLSGPLELEIAGVRQPVKSTEPFAFNSLPENRPSALQFPQWKATAP